MWQCSILVWFNNLTRLQTSIGVTCCYSIATRSYALRFFQVVPLHHWGSTWSQEYHFQLPQAVGKERSNISISWGASKDLFCGLKLVPIQKLVIMQPFVYWIGLVVDQSDCSNPSCDQLTNQIAQIQSCDYLLTSKATNEEAMMAKRTLKPSRTRNPSTTWPFPGYGSVAQQNTAIVDKDR